MKTFIKKLGKTMLEDIRTIKNVMKKILGNMRWAKIKKGTKWVFATIWRLLTKRNKRPFRYHNVFENIDYKLEDWEKKQRKLFLIWVEKKRFFFQLNKMYWIHRNIKSKPWYQKYRDWFDYLFPFVPEENSWFDAIVKFTLGITLYLVYFFLWKAPLWTIKWLLWEFIPAGIVEVFFYYPKLFINRLYWLIMLPFDIIGYLYQEWIDVFTYWNWRLDKSKRFGKKWKKFKEIFWRYW